MTAHYHDIVEQTEGDEVISGFRSFSRPANRFYHDGVKRFLDILFIILGLPVVLPVVFILACLVALDGGRPFYTQERVGRNGRIYRIWKLRTMVHDAEAALERYLAAHPVARAEWNLSQKLKRDPRVTRMGRFLRAYSLDELPQLWNVLKGEMSLVGPRPMMPNQRILYPGSAYYSLRPGITGSWQVMQRNRSSFADRAWYDTQYHRDVSLRTDISLLLATVRVVMKATGH